MYNYFTRHLVEKTGYDPDVRSPYDSVKNKLIFRSIVIDKKKGNLLKLGANGKVLRAYHGSTQMSREQIREAYPSGLSDLCDAVLLDFNHKENYHVLDNYFELTVGLVFANLVDSADKKDGHLQSYLDLWADIVPIYQQYYMETPTEHGDNQFPYFSDHIAKYTDPCSPAVKQWLKALKRENKTVFLMTSSYCHFSRVLLQHVLGNDYEDYFDFFLGKTGKPRFFFMDRPFLKEGCSEQPVEEIERKAWYEEGSYVKFIPLLQKFTSKQNPKVVYFGDGLKNDVFPCKFYAGWSTVLILEGMWVEGLTCSDDDGDDGPCAKKIRSNNMAVGEEDRACMGSSPCWGSFFSEDGEETLWAKVIRSYTDLAVPGFEFITDLPLDHKFHRFKPDKLSALGYYPSVCSVVAGSN